MTKDAGNKIPLTAEQAEGLLADGAYVHNFASGPMMLIGCDYGRADAIKAFRQAKSIELAGPGAMAMKHPIAVDDGERITFFAADMDKVAAFEAAL